MSQKSKLIQRFCNLPKDFTWEELEKLLKIFNFEISQKGKTSGSRVQFYNKNYPPINLHRPHPGNIVKEYVIKELKAYFERENLI